MRRGARVRWYTRVRVYRQCNARSGLSGRLLQQSCLRLHRQRSPMLGKSGDRKRPRCYDAEIHKLFWRFYYRKAPPCMRESIYKTFARLAYIERKTAGIAVSRRPWALGTFKARKAWAFDVTNCRTWTSTERPLVNMTQRMLILCTHLNLQFAVCQIYTESHRCELVAFTLNYKLFTVA